MNRLTGGERLLLDELEQADDVQLLRFFWGILTELRFRDYLPEKEADAVSDTVTVGMKKAGVYDGAKEELLGGIL